MTGCLVSIIAALGGCALFVALIYAPEIARWWRGWRGA